VSYSPGRFYKNDDLEVRLPGLSCISVKNCSIESTNVDGPSETVRVPAEVLVQLLLVTVNPG